MAPLKALAAVEKEFGRKPAAAATAAKVNAVAPGVNPGDLAKQVGSAPILKETQPGPAPVADDPLVKLVLASSDLTARKKAEHLFLVALQRMPNKAEGEAIDRLLAKSSDDPHRALLAIWTGLQSR